MGSMNAGIKAYMLELGGAMLAYAAVLVGSIFWLEAGLLDNPAARAAVALAPMLPCGLACWAILRQLRRLDELGMRIQLEALAFAFAASALLTFSYGFLEGIGWPRLSLFVVWPVMAALWSLGLAMATLRYR